MGEIKYRAWDTNMKVMHDNFLVFEEKLEAMLYLGRKDINGKEICVGDIVKKRFGIGVGIVKHGIVRLKVNDEYDVEYFGFYIDYGKQNDKDYTNMYDAVTPLIYGDVEVIGNIYENHELMKVVE